MQHSPAIAFFKTEDDRLVYVNKAFEEQVWDGRPPEWRNRTGDELWPPEVARQYRENDLRVLRGGRAEIVEEVVIKPNATETWLTVKCPLIRACGERFLAGMALNVTESKRAEAALRESEAFLRMSQRVGRVGSWQWDLQTNRVRWSEAMYQIYGVAPERFDVTLEAVLGFTHPDDRAAGQINMERLFRGGQLDPLEYRIIRPNGEVRPVGPRRGDA